MINTEINSISDKIQSTVHPKQIYLFGSYAKGTYTENSDYDFYVVVADNAGDKIELSQKTYKSLRGIRKHPVDIIIGYESSFNHRSQKETLEKEVKQKGILLYAESGDC